MAKRPTRFERDMHALHGEVVQEYPPERTVYVQAEPEMRRVMRTPFAQLSRRESWAKVAVWTLYGIAGAVLGIVFALLVMFVVSLARHG